MRRHLLRRMQGAELIECGVDEGSPADGEKIRDIRWPSGSILVAHWHGSKVTVPAADDVIRGGDNVYAVVTRGTRRKFLKLIRKR
ncbi:MAG: TrkA C-terminal domain-containing protein [Verrucomicrobiota bacterium]